MNERKSGGLLKSLHYVLMFRHMDHWLSVNESFIPLCLSPLTDTLWLWLSCAAFCLPANAHSLKKKKKNRGTLHTVCTMGQDGANC